MKNKKFWNWTNQTSPPDAEVGAERVLEIYGTIAEESWFEDDVTPQMFRNELFAGSGPVVIWLNSPGGDCIAASQIYSMLMDYPSDVTIKIDGIAASAASVIAMAGTKVLMAPTALMMIHNPMTFAFGDHGDMHRAMEMLDEVKESIINAYEIRTGLSRAKLSHLMDSETWMNANKSIELSFADDILMDEKRVSGEEAFAFSAKAAQVSLMNKLTRPVKKDGLKADPAKAAAINKPESQENVTPVEKTGTPIDDLEKRLSLLK
jgi:ATP-dependent Clp protease protease subunit